MSNNLNIGWIGLGNIGVPMVKNLIKAGHHVTVYNRNPEKSAALHESTGVAVSKSPADLVASSDFIITMISDDAAVKAVYEAEDGIFSVPAKEGLITIDMSTVSPETTRYLAAVCADKGITYLDAPVSGSIKPAEEGQLVIMVGGEEAAYEKAKPIFEVLGKSSTYLGESGKGNSAKLAINLFLGIIGQGLSEAVVFAEKNGVSAEELLPLINGGPLGSGFTKMKSENIVSNNYKPAFSLKLLAKDIKLAEDNGMDTPFGQSLTKTIGLAIEKGHGDRDMIGILNYLSGK
jgi:3-hydroxyisobutyrate dehydrogenase